MLPLTTIILTTPTTNNDPIIYNDSAEHFVPIV